MLFVLILALPLTAQQPLPKYLGAAVPQPGATGVALNSGIVLMPTEAYYASHWATTLQTQAGQQIELTMHSDGQDALFVPKQPLEPSTTYTVRITPSAWIGSAFEYNFTTGAAPALDTIQVAEFNPAAGSTGANIFGPFRIRFNRAVLNSSARPIWRAIQLFDGKGYGVYHTLKVADDRLSVELTPPVSNSGPTLYRVAVDVERLVDQRGISGSGPPQQASFQTILAPSTAFETLAAYPGNGDEGVPTNIQPQILYSRPVLYPQQDYTASLRCGETPIPVQVLMLAYGQVLGVKASQLLPPSSSCQWSIGSGITDQHGFAAPAFTASFTTADGPEIRPSGLVESSPVTSILLQAPSNAWPRLRYSRRIHPVAAAQPFVFVGWAEGDLHQASAAPEFFAGGTGLIFRASAPLKPRLLYEVKSNSYGLGLWDITGEQLTSPGLSIRYQEQADTEPPALTMTVPASGSLDVPAGSEIVLGFSEQMGTALLPDAIVLTQDGKPVPFRIVRGIQSLRLRPDQPLVQDSTYTVRLNGLADVAGNLLPETSFEFRTVEASGSAPQFYSTARQPAAGAVNVDPAVPIEFTFTLPVAGVQPATSLTVGSSTGPELDCLTEVSGVQVRVIPAGPLPPGQTILVAVTALDSRAREAFSSMQFQTAPAADAGTFQLESVSPEPGAISSGRQFELKLRFQQPVNPATVNSSTLAIDNGTSRVNPTFYFSADFREVFVQTPASPIYSVFATNQIKSISGASLEPRMIDYSVTAALQGQINSPGRPLARPSFYTLLRPTDPFTLFFPQPLDPAGPPAWALVSVNGIQWPGELETGAQGYALSFRPSEPYPAGAKITVYDLRQFEVNQVLAEFVVQSTAAFEASFDPETPMPAQPVLEFAFPEAVDPALLNFTLMTNGGGLGAAPVALRVSTSGERRLRATPESALDDGLYRIIIETSQPQGTFHGYTNTFTVANRPDAAAAALHAAPVRGSSGVALTSQIGILFDEAVNRLTLDRNTVRLIRGGETVPAVIETVKAGGVRLTPLVPLRPETEYQVVLDGVEDQRGRRVELPEWRFQTGSHLDFEAPQYTSSAQAYGYYRTLAPGASLAVEASEPLDPASVLDNAYGLQVWAIALSADLRTLTLTPPSPRDRGQTVYPPLRSLRDQSGNTNQGLSLYYTTGIVEDSEPPRLLDIFPWDGLAAAPVNVQIAISFNEPVDAASLSSIRLLWGGQPIRLKSQPGVQNMVFLRPERLLTPGESYLLVVEGVRDIWGNPMDGSREAAFQVVPVLETAALSCSGPQSLVLPANARIHLTFSRPIAPATVLNSVAIHKLSAASGSYASVPVPARVLLSSDGKRLTLVPESGLEPGASYVLRGTDMRDYSGAGCSSGYTASYTFGAGPAVFDPPAITTWPQDGATAVPLNTRLSAITSSPVLPISSPALRLFCDGEEIPLVRDFYSINYVPDGSGLLPRAAQCRMEIPAFEDYAGNRSQPFEVSFTVADTTVSDNTRPKVVSTDPVSGSAGLDPASPVTIRFNEPMRKLAANPPEIVLSMPDLVWGFRGAVSVSGSDVIIRESPLWPAASALSLLIQPTTYAAVPSLSDLAGNGIERQTQYSFRTAALPDSDPPSLVSVTPAPDSQLRAIRSRFTLQFSEPVVMRRDAITLFAGTQAFSFTPLLSADARNIEFLADIPPDSNITMLLGDRITDLAGNPLKPQQFTWTSLAAEFYSQVQVSSVTPANHASVHAGVVEILLDFSRPMDPDSTLAAIRVSEDGQWVDGEVSLDDVRRRLRFLPARAFKPGSRVDVFVLSSAMDVDGVGLPQNFVSRFLVGPAPSPTALEVVRKNVVASSDSRYPALEIEFSQPLDPASVHDGSVWARAGARLVQGQTALVDDRLIRFQLFEPLPDDGAIVLTAGAALRSSSEERFAGADFAFTLAEVSAPAEIVAVDEDEDGVIRLRFNAPVSGSARFDAALTGPAGPLEFRWLESADRLEWRLVPMSPRTREPLTLQFKGESVWKRRQPAAPAAVQ
ncbi:MAG: Ig-like domain-containing protein [Bryobacteraceae bacterium]|nr:Ig-like domain-containing protein [Bryobacteraceae bacterium]